MIAAQLFAPGQLTGPGVNFASVHGLTPVTVHMSFSLPRGNFERLVTRCTTPYCLTKISIRAKRSISRVFFLFIVPSPFFCTLPVQRPY